MQQEIKFEEQKFNQIEKEILNDVMITSKAVLETFKFKMILDSNLKQQQINKTLKGLKEFRKQNWNQELETKKAYKKYLNLF